MGQASGYTCDYCGKFAVAKAQVAGSRGIPAGWMMLVVPMVEDKLTNSFDLCSNKCVRMLASRREKELERGEVGVGRVGELDAIDLVSKGLPVDRSFAPSILANHTRHHVNKGIVSVDCPVCQAETEPRVTQLEENRQ